MTVIRTNSFEGNPVGTALTAANSGGVSGNAFTGVITPTGGSNTVVATPTFTGGRALDMLTPTTAGTQNLIQYTGLTSTTAALRFYFRMSALPGTATQIVQVANVGTMLADVAIATDGGLIGQVAGTTVWTSTSKLSTGTWYRIEVACQSATAGTGTFALGYASGAGPLVESFTSSTLNMGAAVPIERFNLGKLSGTWSSAHLFWDDVAVSNTASFIGSIPQAVGSATFLGSGTLTFAGAANHFSGAAGFLGSGTLSPGGATHVSGFGGGGTLVATTPSSVSPVKTWNGTTWVTAPVFRWDGAQWIPTAVVAY